VRHRGRRDSLHRVAVLASRALRPKSPRIPRASAARRPSSAAFLVGARRRLARAGSGSGRADPSNPAERQPSRTGNGAGRALARRLPLDRVADGAANRRCNGKEHAMMFAFVLALVGIVVLASFEYAAR
jgi:hypothetical protein